MLCLLALFQVQHNVVFQRLSVLRTLSAAPSESSDWDFGSPLFCYSWRSRCDDFCVASLYQKDLEVVSQRTQLNQTSKVKETLTSQLSDYQSCKGVSFLEVLQLQHKTC